MMKKLLILIACLCVLVSVPGFSLKKGTKGVGGSLSFSSSKFGSDSNALYNLRIAPQFSYFVLDHFCIDTSLLYSSCWEKDRDAVHSIGIGLGARYFFKKFYGGAYFQYYGSKSHTTFALEDDINSNVTPVTNWMWSKDLTFKAGRLFDITKNVYLDLGVYYTMGIGKIVHKADASLNFDNETSNFGTLAGIIVFFK
jgi:hypothetical protein